MPDEDYQIFIQHTKDIFGSEIDCDTYSDRPCVFNAKCDAISSNEIPFKITI